MNDYFKIFIGTLFMVVGGYVFFISVLQLLELLYILVAQNAIY